MNVMKAYLYCRISSGKQKDGYGIQRQSDAVLEYLSNSKEAEKLGYKLSPDHYEMLDPDLGKSGYHHYQFTKGALGRFKQRVADGEIACGALVIENVDRFSRAEEYTASEEFNFLIQRGIDIHEVETGIVYSSKISGTLSKLSHAIERAHGESERKSRMASKSWSNRHKKALEQGIALKTNHPRWLRIVDDHYEVLKEQLAIYIIIFERFLEGHGIAVLLDYLNENGILNNGKRWTRTSLHHILRDRRLIGYNKDNRIYPIAINEQMFKRVQDHFDSQDGSTKRRTTRKMRNVFNGMTKCGVCKSAMIANKNPHGKHHLYCVKKRGDKHACSASACRYEYVEKEVLKHLHNIDWNSVYSNKNKVSVDVQGKNTQLIDLARRIDELQKEMTGADHDMVLALVRSLKVLRKEHQELKDELTIISTDVKPKFNFDISEVIEQKNVSLRQEINVLIKKTVHKIFVQKFSGHIYVNVEYYNTVLSHMLVLENLTGKLLANIAIIDTSNELRISSNGFSIWHDKTKDIWNVSDFKAIGSRDFFLALNHMSQFVDREVIDDLFDMWEMKSLGSVENMV